MTTDGYRDIDKLDASLWEAADNLRANSKLTSSDYFMPVLGVIFLRHAANRFEEAASPHVFDIARGKDRRPVARDIRADNGSQGRPWPFSVNRT